MIPFQRLSVAPVIETLDESVIWISDHSLHVWSLAILFYGIGDITTTFIGLSITGIVEVGPVAAPLLRKFGFQFMIVLKAVFFAGCLLCWRLAPDPPAVGIPLGLSILGILVSVWNLGVILTA